MRKQPYVKAIRVGEFGGYNATVSLEFRETLEHFNLPSRNL